MSEPEVIRVLVVDDEHPIREAYRELLEARPVAAPSEAARLRARLFEREGRKPDAGRPAAFSFEVHLADQAQAGVDAVRAQLERGQRFDVAFLDMRMPPGPDGAWAAAAIRALDAAIDIVIVTAYSDVDPADLSARIPPGERLFYLQKPFHAHEVRQLALALGGRARAEAHIRRLAYFDSLTGLANRELVREHMAKALALAKRHSRKLAVCFIDLDNFKRINDTLGHSVGDEILKGTALRLRETVRDVDMVTYASQLARMAATSSSCYCPK